MSTLKITNLQAGIPGKQILNGIELTVKSGEVHAIMGPNGAGKSTMSGVIMGKPGYEVISGSVSIDGEELLGKPAWERALAGLHLVMQYPTEVPGVHIDDVMREAFTTRGRDSKEAGRINFSTDLVARSLNVDLSGGEKKRNETLQLSLLKPKFAILDELDSGLDIDALRDCARRVEAATTEDNLGVLVITHYARLLEELKPDHVHILAAGRIVKSGGPELADELEKSGYAAFQ
jgi:Fe-S cluster assembly ATP-binding protein